LLSVNATCDILSFQKRFYFGYLDDEVGQELANLNPPKVFIRPAEKPQTHTNWTHREVIYKTRCLWPTIRGFPLHWKACYNHWVR